ncbi:MAG: hypothetical protein ACI9EW_000323 [Cellvibrionaceae bacterium]|jgi:hypothetical protein
MKQENPSNNRWKMRIDNNCLFIDDVEFGRVMLQQNARPGMRPYIHPLRIGEGNICLTEDSPWHHPWQHGLQTGFHGVNGCSFWFDPGQVPNNATGTIEPGPLQILSADSPSWSVDALWRHTDGTLLLIEKQTWMLSGKSGADSLLYLDLDWSLQAVPDVSIDQNTYGGFFVRMPFRKQVGATVINSEGQTGNETEQQAAAWIDLIMPIENSDIEAGMTLMDHPRNVGHPALWRVDNQRGINPAPCIAGKLHLAAGERMSYSYRMVLHNGALTVDEINKQWGAYAKKEG